MCGITMTVVDTVSYCDIYNRSWVQFHGFDMFAPTQIAYKEHTWGWTKTLVIHSDFVFRFQDLVNFVFRVFVFLCFFVFRVYRFGPKKPSLALRDLIVPSSSRTCAGWSRASWLDVASLEWKIIVFFAGKSINGWNFRYPLFHSFAN